jgi:hypothetical protein
MMENCHHPPSERDWIPESQPPTVNKPQDRCSPTGKTWDSSALLRNIGIALQRVPGQGISSLPHWKLPSPCKVDSGEAHLESQPLSQPQQALVRALLVSCNPADK